ncbi:MAG: gliding motility-associated C-terminal domain-containing protein [Bacteroidota bacterium]|jgi:gliding motility-associated-like protein|nr:gliding motility-associated C-terminal domain-containing protein [Bacteroidota bacterium]MCA6443261.1 gliding motility-associated C-terminal domain-containing protein [Bacteroidota bacterium]
MKGRLFILIFLLSINLFAQVPTATIGSTSGTVCTERIITFTSVTNNSPTTYSWSVNPSNSAEFIGSIDSPSTQIKLVRSGTAIVSLLVANSTSFSVSSQTVVAIQSAKASFNASLTSVGFPSELVLTNFSNNYTGVQWLFNNSLPDNTFNTSKTYSVGGVYSTTLIALGSFGCNDSSTYSFTIDDFSSITLPNIFTPNEDGVNDIYKPILKGIKEIDVTIYNRFGTLIHSWDRIGGKWDGYTTSGLKCSEGTYFIIVKATGFDGKLYNLKNTITLIE